MTRPLTHALLLTAGLGTRLHPLTTVRAKPAIPVAGVPMACRILEWLRTAGISDVVMNLHHRPASLASIVGDGGALGVRVRYSWEHPEVLGSAGGPRQALDIIGADRFLIVNGDTLTDAAIEPLASAHDSSGALVTLAVIPNTQPQHYSGLRLADDGAVLGVEPRGSSAPSFHFIGVQVAQAAAFASLEKGRAANSIGGLYQALIDATPGCIRAHVCDARFDDIGTVRDYWRTSWRLAREEATCVADAAPQAAGGAVVETILWDRVTIDPGARLSRCIVTDDVHVRAGEAYASSILLRGHDGPTIAVPFDPEL